MLGAIAELGRAGMVAVGNSAEGAEADLPAHGGGPGRGQLLPATAVRGRVRLGASDPTGKSADHDGTAQSSRDPLETTD